MSGTARRTRNARSSWSPRWNQLSKKSTRPAAGLPDRFVISDNRLLSLIRYFSRELEPDGGCDSYMPSDPRWAPAFSLRPTPTNEPPPRTGPRHRDCGLTYLSQVRKFWRIRDGLQSQAAYGQRRLNKEDVCKPSVRPSNPGYHAQRAGTGTAHRNGSYGRSTLTLALAVLECRFGGMEHFSEACHARGTCPLVA